MSFVLALNAGSSSLKFALYEPGDPPVRGLHGKVDRIGARGSRFVFSDPVRKQHDERGIGDLDHRSAAEFLFDWLDDLGCAMRGESAVLSGNRGPARMAPSRERF